MVSKSRNFSSFAEIADCGHIYLIFKRLPRLRTTSDLNIEIDGRGEITDALASGLHEDGIGMFWVHFIYGKKAISSQYTLKKYQTHRPPWWPGQASKDFSQNAFRTLYTYV